LGTNQSTTVTLQIPTNDSSDKPILILLHGDGGDISDMSNPLKNYSIAGYDNKSPMQDKDQGWKEGLYPTPPLFPTVGFDSDQKLSSVTSWQQALTNVGYATIKYGQTGKTDHLAIPTQELTALLHTLIQDSRYFGRGIFLIGHSRGGLLARAVVAEAKNANPKNSTLAE